MAPRASAKAPAATMMPHGMLAPQAMLLALMNKAQRYFFCISLPMMKALNRNIH
jgi:hypothetical protein